MRISGACVLGVVGVLGIAACGGRALEASDDGGTAATSRAGATSVVGASPGDPAPPGDVTRGRQLYRAANVQCNACHGEQGEGLALFAPNITMSASAGIGAWSYEQFFDAVRSATDRDGQPLCSYMIRYSPSDLNDQEIADIYSFLRATLSDIPVRGAYCR